MQIFVTPILVVAAFGFLYAGSCELAHGADVGGSVGIQSYSDIKNKMNTYDERNRTMNSVGFAEKTDVPARTDNPECGPLVAHCGDVCVTIDLNTYNISQPLSVIYLGKFKDDKSQCNGGDYHSCGYNKDCVDGWARFFDQRERIVEGHKFEVCARLKNWNTGYGRCGWVVVNGVIRR